MLNILPGSFALRAYAKIMSFNNAFVLAALDLVGNDSIYSVGEERLLPPYPVSTSGAIIGDFVLLREGFLKYFCVTPGIASPTTNA